MKHEDEAAYYLGHMHENGYGCLKSMAKAIRYYEITTDKKGKKRLAEIYYSMDEYRDLSLAYEYACDTPGAEEIASNIAGNIKNIIDIELFNDYGGNTLRYLNNLNIVVKLTKVNSKNIEEIIIDEGVTKIYPKAFSDFTNLKKITIPSTVEIIKPETFSNLANLEIVNISEGLKRIEAYAFENCNKIKNIVIPHSIDFVSLHAFEGHNLDTLTIPSWFISFVERIFGKYTESISLDDRTMMIKFK